MAKIGTAGRLVCRGCGELVGPPIELVAGIEGRATGAPHARLDLLVRVDVAGHSLEELRDAVAEHRLVHEEVPVVVELLAPAEAWAREERERIRAATAKVPGTGEPIEWGGTDFSPSIERPKTEATPPRRGRVRAWWSGFVADERRGRL